MKFTREQVIEMARGAGFDVELAGVFDPTEGVIGAGDLSDELTRLCTLAADRALEAAAVECDGVYHQHIGPQFGEVRYGIAACATAIRAMKEHQ